MLKRIINKLGIYKTYRLKIGERTYRVPISKGLGFPNFWNAEPWMDGLLKRLGSNDTKFLDVGVNVGQTLLKWKALYPKSTYVGFEPNLNCVAYINDLIKKNNLQDSCKVHPYGLSTEASDSKLYLLGRDKGDASASIIADFRANENRSAIDVKTIPLKAVETTVFDLIKIDVEGAELEVLQSIFELLETPVIICEILPVYTAENKDRLRRQNEINTLLAENGYFIYRVGKEPKLTLNKLSAFDIHGDITKSDYVFVHASKEKDVIANFT